MSEVMAFLGRATLGMLSVLGVALQAIVIGAFVARLSAALALLFLAPFRALEAIW